MKFDQIFPTKDSSILLIDRSRVTMIVKIGPGDPRRAGKIPNVPWDFNDSLSLPN